MQVLSIHVGKGCTRMAELDWHGIGRRMAGRRTEHRWTQKELAQKAGLSQFAVARLEMGDRPNARLQTIVNLAEALDMDLLDLLYGHERR